MTENTTSNWTQANQRHLSAALAVIRELLLCYIARLEGSAYDEEKPRVAQRALDESEVALPSPSALETLCATFGLSPFERDILLLCAGIELDPGFASLCATAQGNTTRMYPTFNLALAALPGAHWNALPPNAPLRHWRLIEAGAGKVLTQAPLYLDERILHYLVGVQHLDERLVGIVEPLSLEEELVPSHRIVLEQMKAAWSQPGERATFPVIQLCGSERTGKHIIATILCDTLGFNLFTLAARAIPTQPIELDTLLHIWEREAALSNCVLFLDCEEMDTEDNAHLSILTRFIERLRSLLIVSNHERRLPLQRSTVTFEVCKPTTQEQRLAWQHALGTEAHHLNGHMELLVSQFSLNTATIQAASSEALSQVKRAGETAASSIPAQELGNALWQVCRTHSRPRLNDLAQRIEAHAGWNDLILPEGQRQTLCDIAAHVRQRSKVYETWGFASRSARGLGISALFSGASGTGKTMAAEVLANELQLDLYRIDLSQVVSKYIGETEKNLRRVFDAAEEGGVLLLFDEADSLFGKRSEVKDSHDRYANIEVSYLLQRMEAYRGLAILTTNMKSALDSAFLRRIRFIVQFPFPDVMQRMEIWRRIFPVHTPTEGLDQIRLAQLNVTGGNIRNIALNAAFLAADAQQPVRMTHLLRAARSEYAKLEKNLTEVETGGWL